MPRKGPREGTSYQLNCKVTCYRLKNPISEEGRCVHMYQLGLSYSVQATGSQLGARSQHGASGSSFRAPVRSVGAFCRLFFDTRQELDMPLAALYGDVHTYILTGVLTWQPGDNARVAQT